MLDLGTNKVVQYQQEYKSKSESGCQDPNRDLRIGDWNGLRLLFMIVQSDANWTQASARDWRGSKFQWEHQPVEDDCGLVWGEDDGEIYMYIFSMEDLFYASQSCGRDDKERPAVGLLPMGDGNRILWEDAVTFVGHCVSWDRLYVESLS